MNRFIECMHRGGTYHVCWQTVPGIPHYLSAKSLTQEHRSRSLLCYAQIMIVRMPVLVEKHRINVVYDIDYENVAITSPSWWHKSRGNNLRQAIALLQYSLYLATDAIATDGGMGLTIVEPNNARVIKRNAFEIDLMRELRVMRVRAVGVELSRRKCQGEKWLGGCNIACWWSKIAFKRHSMSFYTIKR